MTELAGSNSSKKEIRSPGPVRMLVVEDDPATTMLLEASLAGIEGLDMVYTDNVEDALELLKDRELVISDKGLKINKKSSEIDKEGGYKIADEFGRQESEKRPGESSIPSVSNFILLTGDTHVVPKTLAEHKIGAYITKPFSPRQMMDRIKVMRDSIITPLPPVSS